MKVNFYSDLFGNAASFLQTHNPPGEQLKNSRHAAIERVRRAGRPGALGQQLSPHATAQVEPRRQHHEFPQVGVDRGRVPVEAGAGSRQAPRGLDLSRELLSEKHRRTPDER